MVPPAAALVVVIAWNAVGQRSARVADEEKSALRLALDQAKGTGRPASLAERGVAKKSSSSASGGEVDWHGVSRRLADMQGRGVVTDLKSMLDLQQKLAGMQADELAAALDEIQSLGLPDDERSQLEAMLLEPLIERDPGMALARFADRIGKDEDPVGWQLSSAMAAWAKKDPAAAAAWFDRQIAAGVFESKSLDGRSQARIEFEGALVAELLAGNPDAAGQRIAALPEDQRREALEQIAFSDLSPEAREAYAALVRQLVPADERAGSFTHVISDLVQGAGFDEVDRFLDQIKATPEEREVSAREAANARFGEIAGERPLTRQDVDTMREWIEKQAPGTADRVTGEALGDAAQDGGEFDFDAASKLAIEYHQRSSNDDVMVAFLESFAARSNVEQALTLVDRIRNPQRRQEILELLK